MDLIDLANAALAQYRDQERHRHWMIYFPDRGPVEVIFAPGIKHKTVRLVYREAASATPITDDLDQA